MSTKKKTTKNNKKQQIYKKYNKYQNETIQLCIDGRGEDAAILSNNSSISKQLIINTDVQGVRKIKNLTFNIQSSFKQNGERNLPPMCFAYFVVYVPTGQQPLAVNLSNANFSSGYGDNRNVLLYGLVPKDKQLTFKTKMARNLNSGESNYLIIVNLTEYNLTSVSIFCTLNYVIAYN